MVLPTIVGQGMAADVDYESEVRPILARHCVSCHGAAKPRGDLRLDSVAASLRGTEALGPALVPGHPDESALYLAVIGEGGGERMPYRRPPLSEVETDTLRRWIAEGARHPVADSTIEFVGETRHWSFLPVERPEIPVQSGRDWIQNPIDAFILEPLVREGIKPSEEADRATLLRRLSLDLIGLPPSLSELDQFTRDMRPTAFSRVVDRLLASPHYGERRARQWLDLARYADSNGYSIDAPRSIWPYRDWVIAACNADLGFDQFTIDQIAGDLKPNATLADRVATGFHRNTPINQEGGIDPEQFRVESVIDRVATTATTWLGLTVACAQCHDHKYDPISQRDYYGLFAFLNDCDEPELGVADQETIARREALQGEIDAYLARIRREDPALDSKMQAWETGLPPEQRQKQSQAVRAAFDTPFADRAPGGHAVVFAAFIDQAPGVESHRNYVENLRRQMPVVPNTLVMRARARPRETCLLVQGDFTRPGDRVEPAAPSALPPIEGADKRRTDRMDLAKWLVDSGNPLTSRVVVNRIWQHYFGRGIVETENDFGTQGALPSHPELLDWLAGEFMSRDWSTKSIERVIVSSATYRQNSANRRDLAASDPENRRLARQSRLRLDAELVRDSALVAGGLLTSALGGPSVFPPQPEGVMNLGQMRREWKPSLGTDRYRRGMYTYLWRATPHPLLVTFDAPEGTRTCSRRVRSNTPLQALILLNDEAFHEFSGALANRVLGDPGVDDHARLDRMFRLALSRSPTSEERAILMSLLEGERESIAARGEGSSTEGTSRAHEGTCWRAVARAILNLDEFITRE
jgi:hypothetical protein